MPKDINLLLEEGDINHLNNILLDENNDFKFFHQLGILHPYLQVDPEGSDGAHIYLRIPRVAHQYAFGFSNRCENIFTKAGQRIIIKESQVYVMTSELNVSYQRKLRGVPAFFKNDKFFQIIKKGGKKGSKEFNGLPMKLYFHIYQRMLIFSKTLGIMSKPNFLQQFKKNVELFQGIGK